MTAEPTPYRVIMDPTEAIWRKNMLQFVDMARKAGRLVEIEDPWALDGTVRAISEGPWPVQFGRLEVDMREAFEELAYIGDPHGWPVDPVAAARIHWVRTISPHRGLWHAGPLSEDRRVRCGLRLPIWHRPGHVNRVDWRIGAPSIAEGPACRRCKRRTDRA